MKHWRDLDKGYKQKLISQINNSPIELKSYVHALEVGCDGSLIIYSEQLRQENQEMKFIIDRWWKMKAEFEPNKFIIINTKEIHKLSNLQQNHLICILNTIDSSNKYYCCNEDEPYSHLVLDIILQGEGVGDENNQ